MIEKYDRFGLTMVHLDVSTPGAPGAPVDPFKYEVQHFELDGQPPPARPSKSWRAPYTGT